jgi:predicted porin
VTLYGIMDLGLQSSKATIGTDTYKQTAMSNGVQSGSRIGFKGTEDLGGGLNANFVYEAGTDPDVASTVMTSNRQSYVGLAGNFGSVNLGRQYTLHHSNQGAGDMLGNLGLAGYLGGLDSLVRQSNAVTYMSPSFGGVTVAAQMGFGETVTNAAQAAGANSATLSNEKKNEQTALRVAYAAGPLAAGLAYETVKNGAFAAVTYAGQATGLTAFDYDKRKAMNISASYDFGVAKVGFVNNNTKFDDSTGTTKWAANTLSVAAPMGAVTAFASFGAGKLKDVDGSTITKASAYQLGASYALSKRTNVYAFTGQTKLKDLEAKLGQTVVGVRHQF